MSEGGTLGGVPEVVGRPSRLRALAALEPNAETSAAALDRIAGVACRLLGAPVVVVNLVGRDKQRFLGCGGPDRSAMPVREMPLSHGFCPFALGADRAYAFADAQADPALAANPVVEQLGVRAYAGVPLRAPGGEPVGTLCAIDTEPHPWSEEDLDVLTDLAASAASELQLLAATARHHRRVRALAELGPALAQAGTGDEIVAAVRPAVACVGARDAWLAGRDAPAEPAFLPTRSDVRAALAQGPDAGAVALLPLAEGALAVAFDDEGELGPEDATFLAAVAGIARLATAA